MSQVTIYHNPRCSKSRQTLALLEERGITPDIRLYLETPPQPDEIGQLLTQLGLTPRELMRQKEAVFTELGLNDPEKSEAQLIAAMQAHPILIERPIVVRNGKAVLGRPPENVLALIED